MGATCNHERTTKADETLVHKGILFTTYAINYQCKDCPKKIKHEELRRNLTGIKYSMKEIEPKTCKHLHYTIDDSTREICKEQTLEGSILPLFMGPAMDGIQYQEYFFAHAKCDLCDFLFCVRAEKVCENQEKTDVYTIKWNRMRKKENGKEYYVAVNNP